MIEDAFNHLTGLACLQTFGNSACNSSVLTLKRLIGKTDARA